MKKPETPHTTSPQGEETTIMTESNTRIRFRVECVINPDNRMPSWKQHVVTEYADTREELKERVAELKECYSKVVVGSVETIFIEADSRNRRLVQSTNVRP